mgnify:CR=1 FL=1
MKHEPVESFGEKEEEREETVTSFRKRKEKNVHCSKIVGSRSKMYSLRCRKTRSRSQERFHTLDDPLSVFSDNHTAPSFQFCFSMLCRRRCLRKQHPRMHVYNDKTSPRGNEQKEKRKKTKSEKKKKTVILFRGHCSNRYLPRCITMQQTITTKQFNISNDLYAGCQLVHICHTMGNRRRFDSSSSILQMIERERRYICLLRQKLQIATDVVHAARYPHAERFLQ